MKNTSLDREYWNLRYLENDTPWDIGYASPPLKDFLDNIADKNTRILIPGAGRAYEAIYLHERGFGNVFVCDWAPESFGLLKQRSPRFPQQHLLCQDFFSLEGIFDLVLEQTFFCAIPPYRRREYAEKVHNLLSDGGQLVGVLFASPFTQEGPPFGGTKEEYTACFSPWFRILKMENCQNSILPRAGNELFIQLVKQ